MLTSFIYLFLCRLLMCACGYCKCVPYTHVMNNMNVTKAASLPVEYECIHDQHTALAVRSLNPVTRWELMVTVRVSRSQRLLSGKQGGSQRCSESWFSLCDKQQAPNKKRWGMKGNGKVCVYSSDCWPEQTARPLIGHKWRINHALRGKKCRNTKH